MKNYWQNLEPELRWGFVAFLAVLIFYALSFAASFSIIAEYVLAAILVIIAAVAFHQSFTLGFAVVFTELVAGSLGRLFILPFDISIRMAFFAIALVAAIIRLSKNKTEREYIWKRGVVAVWIILAAAILWGLARGLALRPASAVIADANAYAYFILLPAFLLAFREKREQKKLLAAFFGATAASALLTVIVFYLFTHAISEPVLRALYKWVRDYGLGEVTKAPAGFYRVFFQAQIMNFTAFLIGPSLIIRLTEKKIRNFAFISVALSAAVLFISFSRTFWVSALFAMITGAAFVLISTRFRPSFKKYAVICAIFTVIGITLPFLLSRSVGSAVAARAGNFVSEAAAGSRMNLLRVLWPEIKKNPIWGYGFCKELTYKTLDPRLLVYFPSGNYTTSAFEWGWLDFWLKMGAIGPLSFLLLIATLAVLVKDAIKNSFLTNAEGQNLTAYSALALGIATLGTAIAHIASPWLNHPLGIGLILTAYSVLVTNITQTGRLQSG
jgi:hypothetical protein